MNSTIYGLFPHFREHPLRHLSTIPQPSCPSCPSCCPMEETTVLNHRRFCNWTDRSAETLSGQLVKDVYRAAVAVERLGEAAGKLRENLRKMMILSRKIGISWDLPSGKRTVCYGKLMNMTILTFW